MRRAFAAVVVLLVTALLASCARVPTSGPIVEVDQPVAEPASDTVVRALARPPEPGMDQLQVVQGFLDASSSFTNDHEVARQYLTASAARTWNATARVRVYGNDTEELSASGPQTVQLVAQWVGQVSRDRQYVPEAVGSTIDDQFVLTEVEGQWRIDSLPPGLLLSRAAVERSYRKFQTYFIAKPGGILAPNPVLLSSDSRDVATDLVLALLAGPSAWLSPAVVTGFPMGTTLRALTISNAVARIDLSEQVNGATELARQELSAQLVWTLRQVAGVQAVAITVAGEPLSMPDIGQVQPVGSWQTFDPDGLPQDSPWFFQRQGAVLRVDESGVPVRVAGPAGQDEPEVQDPLIALDLAQIGASADDTVLLSRISDSAKWSRMGSGRTQGGSWDRLGWMWAPTGSGGIRAVTELGGQPVKVPRKQVRSVQLSRDGSRALVVAGPPGQAVAYLMRVERELGSLRLSRPRIIVTPPVRAAAWSSASQVAMLVRSPQQPPQVALVDVTAYTVRLLPAPPRARTLAAAPDRPLLAGTGDGRIWGFNGATWVLQTSGQQPRYPG